MKHEPQIGNRNPGAGRPRIPGGRRIGAVIGWFVQVECQGRRGPRCSATNNVKKEECCAAGAARPDRHRAWTAEAHLRDISCQSVVLPVRSSSAVLERSKADWLARTGGASLPHRQLRCGHHELNCRKAATRGTER